MKLTIVALAAALALSASPEARPRQSAQPVVVRVDRGGFDWVDASIGAGAAAGIGIVFAGALGLHPRRRPAEPTTPKEDR